MCRTKWLIFRVCGTTLRAERRLGRADIALAMRKKLYGIGREFKDTDDEQRFIGHQEKSLPILAQLKSWLNKPQSRVALQSALGKVVIYLVNNWSGMERYVETCFLL